MEVTGDHKSSLLWWNCGSENMAGVDSRERTEDRQNRQGE